MTIEIHYATIGDDIQARQGIEYTIMQGYEKEEKRPPWYDCGNVLHHWSRAWEYQTVTDAIKSKKYTKILDAGSGITFYPRYLREHWKKTVICLDYDPRIIAHTGGICEPMEVHQGSYDAIVCVSMLEHMSNPVLAVENMLSCLNPGGKLVCTFDIALDGRSEMKKEKVEKLIGRTDIHQRAKDNPVLFSKTILTSHNSRHGLPGDTSIWKQMKSVILRGGPKNHIPKLCVASIIYEVE